MNLNNLFNNDNKFYLASKESSLVDPSYRYQIDNPQISVTGKNGNRTTWFNNSELFAKSIQRPSEFLTKYISNKLSCASKFDKDKNCQSFKGEYSQELIIEYLHEFIKIYVLCKNCDYPDTKLNLNDKKIITLNCESCGSINCIDIKFMDKTYDFIEKKLK